MYFSVGQDKTEFFNDGNLWTASNVQPCKTLFIEIKPAENTWTIEKTTAEWLEDDGCVFGWSFFTAHPQQTLHFTALATREMLAFPHQRKVYFREHFRNHLNRKVKCLLGILTNLHLSLFGMCLYNSMSHVVALALISDFGFLPENVYATAGLCRSRRCDPLSLLFDVGSDWHGPCLRNIER